MQGSFILDGTLVYAGAVPDLFPGFPLDNARSCAMFKPLTVRAATAGGCE